ncbi:MAG: hypothetical protein EOM20_08220, partial [Spartobacteria bacterium]|nr:hypothetical protein [Spartobacteria bacterium]
MRILKLMTALIVLVLCSSAILSADAGNCLSFDGGGDYAQGTGSLTNASAVTLEAWVKHRSLGSVIQRYLTLGDEVAVIRYDPSGDGLHFYINTDGTFKSLQVSGVLTTGRWRHVAGTWDGAAMRLYCDGREIASQEPGGTLNAPSGAVMLSHSAETLDGHLDEVRVWSTARTGAELRENMHRELTGSESGLAYYWKLNETDGVIAYDAAGDADLSLDNMTDDDWVASDVPFAVDFGDAPAPYPVTLAENGARHAATGPRLGATRDTETNGTHSAAADAEGSEEDGVSGWTSVMVGKAGATVTVNVQNAPDGAKLDAWIDWNGDGCWNGAADRIVQGLPVTNGANTVAFDVPSWALSGHTFARFRLSTAGGLGAGGLAADGEVEDYRIAVAPPTARFEFIHAGRAAASGLTTYNGTSLYPLDMDGDGDIDLLSCDEDGELLWHENDGAGAYTAHSIDTLSLQCSVIGVDLDGDGDMDVVSADSFNGHVYWYENDGAQGFTRHTVASNVGTFTTGLTVVDLDGDGALDIVAACSGTLLWFENDGAQAFAMHTIATHGASTYNAVAAADLDGDGDLDLVGARGGVVSWYENDGRQNFTPNEVSASESELRNVFIADLNGDGHPDILSAGRGVNDTLAWHENDGTGNFTRRGLGVSIAASDVVAADVDGDGNLDLLTFEFTGDVAKVMLLLNDGAGNVTRRVLRDGIGSVGGVCIADADSDGRLDFFAAHNGSIFLYRQIDHDFGDAPAPYPTLLSDDGPRHVTRGPRLGGLRDYETDGFPSAGADGDDLDGLNDEDGVSQPGVIRPGQIGASVTVNVQNAPDGAKLDTWIDWNGDGSWNGPYDRIATGRIVTNGDNVVSFDVPSWAADGVTHARFRISTDGTTTVGGYADDGEVEDHLLTISPPKASSATFVTRLVPGATNRSIFASSAGDLDGDGDVDIVTTYKPELHNAGYVAWWENDGAQNFTEHLGEFIIGDNLALDAKPRLVDLGRDGDLDILVDGAGIMWYENDGTGTFNIHTNVMEQRNSFWALYAADLDADGDLDIVSGHQGGASETPGQYLWYENDGNQGFTTHGITPEVSENRRDLFAADLDRDGDIDLLTLDASANGHIAWQENDGSGSFTNHTIQTGMNCPAGIFAADLDSDGDMDVLSASSGSDTVAWHENTGGGVFVYHEISTNAPGASKITAADLNGNGRMDVVTIGRTTGEVAVYINLGGGNFRRETIYTHGMESDSFGEPSISVIDMDGDGDLDLVSSIGDYQEQGAWVWHENLGLFTIQATAGPHGNIAPGGAVQVIEGGTTNFVITPDTYYHVADVTTNAASIGAVTQFAWSNVVADGTIHADFAADLAAEGTPHWWLDGHDLTAGGTYTFDQAELRVMGPHNFTAGQEYIADTDP